MIPDEPVRGCTPPPWFRALNGIERARAFSRGLLPWPPLARLDIQIRAGVHTGECELEGNRLAGMAVHIAARIQAAAQPGEILVSSTVKDLAVGSAIRFTDKGETALKGVPVHGGSMPWPTEIPAREAQPWASRRWAA